MERKMSMETNAITPKKIAIVTGGSRGIGRSTVESLAKRGVNTIFTYHTHGTDAEAVVAAVKDAGAKAIALQLEAGNVASFDAFVESVNDALANLGATRFDFLVNNAGIRPVVRRNQACGIRGSEGGLECCHGLFDRPDRQVESLSCLVRNRNPVI
jgi:NAD(P)-dependent dehydrogenase (short-subunit alcohol dehydrogenase family)